MQKFTHFLLIMCLHTIAWSQVSKTEVINLGDDQIIEMNKKEPSGKSGFVVKTDLLYFLTGKQEVNIETPLSSMIGLQAGVGITFKNLLSFQDIEENYDDSPKTGVDSKIGLLLSFNPRIYFNGDGLFDVFYIGPSFMYATRKFSKTTDASFGYETRENNQKSMDYVLRIGSQDCNSKNIVWDFNFGIGVRDKWGDYKILNTNINNVGIINKATPLLEFNFKVGLYIPKGGK